MHPSAVTELADVVLPVAPDAQRSGSYLNWEGRRREFGPALDPTGVLPDCRVLDTLAVEMDADLFTQTPAAAAGELARLGGHVGTAAGPAVPAGRAAASRRTGRRCSPPGASSSTSRRWPSTSPRWRARPARRMLRCNVATAERLGLVAGAPATVRTERGTITLPVVIADLPDGVVWLPTNSPGSRLRTTLGAGHGDVVAVTA